MLNSRYVLLNFSALANGSQWWVQGQVVKTGIQDFNFQDFGTLKTAWNMLRLYALKPASGTVVLALGDQKIAVTCDAHGGFETLVECTSTRADLTAVWLNDQKVAIESALYQPKAQAYTGKKLLVTDIDDTVLVTHIQSKLRKLYTMIFTKVARRKAVTDALAFIEKHFEINDAVLYLTNSEHNLHPVIHQFLRVNAFPRGPVLLKQVRTLKDLLLGKKKPPGNQHKLRQLHRVVSFFRDAEITLMGDNTQADYETYLEIANQNPKRVAAIVIRKVGPGAHENRLEQDKQTLKKQGTQLFYTARYAKIEL